MNLVVVAIVLLYVGQPSHAALPPEPLQRPSPGHDPGFAGPHGSGGVLGPADLLFFTADGSSSSSSFFLGWAVDLLDVLRLGLDSPFSSVAGVPGPESISSFGATDPSRD